MALYGFMQLKDLATERVTGSLITVVNNAIGLARAEHERQIDALLNLFVQRTTDYKIRRQSVNNVRNQPLDENGRARVVKPGGYYEIALPIQSSGNAWGANRITQVKMTVAEAERITETLLMGDMRWMRDHILAALFTDVTWTFADPLFGALTVQPLANADAVTYAVLSGSDAPATDTHFLAQAAAIDDDANPFPTIYDELAQHPENGGDVVALVPSNLMADIEALTSYKPVTDPNVRTSGNTDVLIGTLGTAIPGVLRGYADKVYIVEWRAMPSSYIVATTTDGERALAMREHPEAELQGFQMVATRADHPFEESHWERHAGFGAWNRVGAVVLRVGNGTYAIPTNYSSPMP